MKKLLFTFVISLCSLRRALCIAMLSALSSAYAQTIPPPFINYQAVLYDVNGANPNNPLINQSFTTFVNINDELGNLLYREEHYASTDANGLITVKMGDGLYTAGPITNFNQINWGVGKYYLVVDFNINGTISSTAPEQLVTVPYSFYAGKAGNGMTTVADNGNGTLTFSYENGATYTTPVLAGITGAQGPAGADGATGAQGIQGPTGNDGATGAQGPIGLTGPQGPQGLQGPAGNDGAAGPLGPAGVNGLNGQDGAQGPIGLTGAVGPQGPIGLTGAQGPQGIQGPVGATGATGATGLQGPIGLTGPQGLQGIQGPVGATGAAGPQGPAGLIASGTTAGNTPYWNGTAWVTNNSNIFNNGGNVGIGQTTPTSKLEVNGSVTNSTALNAGSSSSINFAQSNLAFTSATGTAITLQNLKNGGAYTLIFTNNTSSGTVTFTASGFTFVQMGTFARTAGKKHIYNFVVVGTEVYVTMAREN